MRALITCLLVLTGLFVYGCSKNTQSKVEYVDIYYVGWDILAIRALSCSDLMEKDFGSHITVTDKTQIGKLASLISQSNFLSAPAYDDIDTRICCILRTENGVAMKQVSFAHQGLMMIDKTVYTVDTTLFDFVVKFLPEDYLFGAP